MIFVGRGKTTGNTLCIPEDFNEVRRKSDRKDRRVLMDKQYLKKALRVSAHSAIAVYVYYTRRGLFCQAPRAENAFTAGFSGFLRSGAGTASAFL